jgi:hypothetical protein
MICLCSQLAGPMRAKGRQCEEFFAFADNEEPLALKTGIDTGVTSFIEK